VAPEGTVQCKFWGLGADGTVGANKSAIKIIGDNTDMYAQAYFCLRLQKIRRHDHFPPAFRQDADQSTYLIDSADYIACHNPSYVNIYDVLEGIKDGRHLHAQQSLEPGRHGREAAGGHAADHRPQKAQILQHRCGQNRRGSGTGRTHQHDHADRLFQGGQRDPGGRGHRLPQGSDQKMFGKKGDKIVNMNNEAVDKTLDHLVEIDYPDSWADAGR
jgi:pyruvate-ferredoxin/flavodoxin oxidoreductase